MPLQHVSESEEDEYHSIGSGHEPEDGEDDAESDAIEEPPVHPVSSMQGAFEESILESTEGHDVARPSTSTNAESRRHRLLEAQQYDDAWATRWKQRPGARYHPLLKLMSQVIFGMHLLQQQQAKSDEEVVKILQTHVNEIDTFLERTSEDFDLAIADTEERIRHLKLPMQHIEVFKVMLDDKKFRTQLLDGNDQIEKIIDRTARAMNAALMDVQKGLQATRELGQYLGDVQEQWPRRKRDIANVYGAMLGNEQGWMKYLKDLQTKGNNLGNHLIQLGMVIGEMSKLAAAASRRNRPTSRVVSPARSAPTSPGLRSKFSRDTPPSIPQMASLNKPLPKEPDTIAGAAQMAIPKLHSVPFAQRFESPRASPRSPPPRSPRPMTIANGVPPRPKTAGALGDARKGISSNAADIAEVSKHSNPLRSNPPDFIKDRRSQSAEKKLTRSHSHGAVDILSTANYPNQDPVARSKTQVAHPPTTNGRSKTEGQSRPTTAGTLRAPSVKSQATERKDSVARLVHLGARWNTSLTLV